MSYMRDAMCTLDRDFIRKMVPYTSDMDNHSTVDMFCNKTQLQNIQESPISMKIYCNACTRTTKMIGDITNYATVWYNSKAIANSSSLKQVKEKYHVYYNSSNACIFYVTKIDREKIEFVESEGGLYYLNTAKQVSKRGVTLVTTLDEKRSMYTNKIIYRL